MTEGLVVGPAAATAGDETFTRTIPHQETQMSISIAPNGQNSQSDPSQFLHYVRKADTLQSMVFDAEVTALCGWRSQVFTTTSGGTGGSANICPVCALLYGALAAERERAVA